MTFQKERGILWVAGWQGPIGFTRALALHTIADRHGKKRNRGVAVRGKEGALGGGKSQRGCESGGNYGDGRDGNDSEQRGAVEGGEKWVTEMQGVATGVGAG